jgi:hypothetical protein
MIPQHQLTPRRACRWCSWSCGPARPQSRSCARLRFIATVSTSEAWAVLHPQLCIHTRDTLGSSRCRHLKAAMLCTHVAEQSRVRDHLHVRSLILAKKEACSLAKSMWHPP